LNSPQIGLRKKYSAKLPIRRELRLNERSAARPPVLDAKGGRVMPRLLQAFAVLAL